MSLWVCVAGVVCFGSLWCVQLGVVLRYVGVV